MSTNKQYETTTTNLADFGARERHMAARLLDAALPEGFDETGVTIMLNRESGHVFLINEDYQVAMFNGNRLELFHSLPYGGAGGFLSDLFEENSPDELNSEDTEYLFDHFTEESTVTYAMLSDEWKEFFLGEYGLEAPSE